jgi:hypothetical protein
VGVDVGDRLQFARQWPAPGGMALIDVANPLVGAIS